jgi:hypothetical protein
MDKCQYYYIGGITVKVDSDIPFTENTYNSKFNNFKVDNPGEDIIDISHHLGLPFTKVCDLGKEVYHRSPWAIYKKDDSWIYVSSTEKPVDNVFSDIAIFNCDYTKCDIYHKNKSIFEKSNWHSLTFFSTDQILISQLLANRKGVLLHSGAVILDTSGIMFVGHSSAGKSTAINMLKDRAEVLCDDRNIVRQQFDSFYVYGTWSHGDVPIVSSSSAPLKAILFLKKSDKNRLVLLKDIKDIRLRLLACIIKPFLTADWWDKSIAVIENIARQVPCYAVRRT